MRVLRALAGGWAAITSEETDTKTDRSAPGDTPIRWGVDVSSDVSGNYGGGPQKPNAGPRFNRSKLMGVSKTFKNPGDLNRHPTVFKYNHKTGAVRWFVGGKSFFLNRK